MKTVLNRTLTLLALLLAIPTILIIASWNALPGDSLYGVKTGLEDAVLVLTARTPAASAFSVKFTERRFSEANKLLATQGSTVGFSLLIEEAEDSKQIISKKRDAQTAAVLLEKIETYEEAIEQQKEAIKTQASAAPTSPPPPQDQPVQKASPKPLPPPVEEPGIICVQVITPAYNPQTGECREFPTPCDVPVGWTRVASCEQFKESPRPSPTKAIQPSPFPSPSPLPSPVAVPQEIVLQPEKTQQVVADLEKTQLELTQIKQQITQELPEAAEIFEKKKGHRGENREKDRSGAREREKEREED